MPRLRVQWMAVLMRASSEQMASVMEDAFRALGHRQLTGSELRQRLLRRGCPEVAVEECLRRLQEMGYLDDRQLARDLAEGRSRTRLLGRKRLVAELEARGVPQEVAEEEVNRVLPEERERELAMTLALKKVSSLDRANRHDICRRVYGHLVRRGFSSELAVKVLEELGVLER